MWKIYFLLMYRVSSTPQIVTSLESENSELALVLNSVDRYFLQNGSNLRCL